MNKKIFKEIAKHISRSNRGIKTHRILYPEREWLISLIISLIIFIVICVYGIRTYNEYKQPFVDNDNTEEVQVVVYRESMVNEALSKFSNRFETHTKLLENLVQKVEENPVVVESLNVATTTLSGTSSLDLIDDVSDLDLGDNESSSTQEQL